MSNLSEMTTAMNEEADRQQVFERPRLPVFRGITKKQLRDEYLRASAEDIRRGIQQAKRWIANQTLGRQQQAEDMLEVLRALARERGIPIG